MSLGKYNLRGRGGEGKTGEEEKGGEGSKFERVRGVEEGVGGLGEGGGRRGCF